MEEIYYVPKSHSSKTLLNSIYKLLFGSKSVETNILLLVYGSTLSHERWLGIRSVYVNSFIVDERAPILNSPKRSRVG